MLKLELEYNSFSAINTLIWLVDHNFILIVEFNFNIGKPIYGIITAGADLYDCTWNISTMCYHTEVVFCCNNTCLEK